MTNADLVTDMFHGMPLIRKNLSHLAGLMLLIGFSTGCAHLFAPPAENSHGRQILQGLAGINAGLTRYKALAHIRIESDGQVISGRIAMAGILPGKLRIEWLDMMGQPLTTLAGDGETITIFSRIDNSTHRLRQSPKALEQLIHIPIGIEDLQTIMVGRLPLPVDVAVQIKEAQGETDKLVLKNRWHNVVATLQADRSTARALAMQTFSAQGEPLYEIQWLQWRNEGNYIVPVKMTFESESVQLLTLTTDRFWPDAEVPETVFKLDAP